MRALLFLLAFPAYGGALSDAILAPGAAGQDAVYEHRLNDQTGTLALSGGALILDGRQVAAFAPQSAHPAVLFLLESAVRHMAEATGGSPFYIRNRIRNALVAADAAPVAPFADDPNRARMGVWADLTLDFTMDDGRVISLSADTADGEGGYYESLTLED